MIWQMPLIVTTKPGMKRQIIALGGGGFSDEPDNPLLEEYILRQSSISNPKICFIGTASGDAEGYINNFYTCFEKKDCIMSLSASWI